MAIENGVSKYSVENNFFTKENYPPTGLTISLDSLKSTSVVINRSNAYDPERKPLTYEVSVNGVTQTIEATAKHVTINNLKPNAQNSIRVTATDNMNNRISVSSNVFTPANENSILYRYFINVNGKERESVIYLPENYKRLSNLPLLFFFHGAGKTKKLEVAKYVSDTDFVIEVIERHMEKSKVNLKAAPIVVGRLS